MIAVALTFILSLALWHTLERIFPIRPPYNNGGIRRGYFADLIAVLVNGPVLTMLTKIGASLAVVAFPWTFSALSHWPWWAQFAVFFIANDFLRYWLHRWYHDFGFLWRVHRVHHTVVEMDALSLMRFHVLEGIIKNGVIFFPFHALGIDDTVVYTYVCIDIFKGFWHHANVRTYIGPLNYVFNSAELHWWHHSIEARGQQANYGSILSIWDWLYGTAYWPRGQWPEVIGVAGLEHFPDDYPRQFASVAYSDAQLAAADSPARQPQVADCIDPHDLGTAAPADLRPST